MLQKESPSKGSDAGPIQADGSSSINSWKPAQTQVEMNLVAGVTLHILPQ